MDINTTKQSLESTWPAHMAMPPETEQVVPALVAHAHGRTDRGKVRAQNEDQFLVASPAAALWVQQSSGQPEGLQYANAGSQFFVVADGMGGHAGGAQASALAVSAVETSLLSTLTWLFALRPTDEPREVDVLSELRTALQQADARVCEEAARRPELSGMGTTLTAAFRHGSSLFIAHAGDSRCYLFRGDKLYRLTQDHTLVSEMVKHGILSSEDEARAPFKHVVTNVVGGPKPGVRVEVHRARLLPDDVILLCTDGLTNMLSDAQIASILAAHPDPREACDRLVDGANDAGGQDNITAIVARCSEAPEKPAT